MYSGAYLFLKTAPGDGGSPTSSRLTRLPLTGGRSKVQIIITPLMSDVVTAWVTA